MTTSTTMTADMSALKTRLKTVWESGDYGVFAKYSRRGPSNSSTASTSRQAPGCWTSPAAPASSTIPAAKRGIQVTGLDLAANLVEQARARAAQEGLAIQIDQGDAEQLPYPDASFDMIMSLIGSMFAPQPELVASEMIRVCKPGGKIIMGNWTPEGHVGQMFKIIGKHVPPPPHVPSPLLWGDEATCRKRLSADVTDLKITRYMYPFEYPFEPAKVVDVFVDYYGPTNRASASLNDEGKKALHDDLTALWTRNNVATDGTTRVPSEYIEVIGIRA